MTTPITDEEIAFVLDHGSARLTVVERNQGEPTYVAYARIWERVAERIRSDAATIAELRGQVAELDARVNRLRATAEMGDLVMRSYSCLGGQCIGHGCAVCMMRDALSTLAPGDLGKDGT